MVICHRCINRHGFNVKWLYGFKGDTGIDVENMQTLQIPAFNIHIITASDALIPWVCAVNPYQWITIWVNVLTNINLWKIYYISMKINKEQKMSCVYIKKEYSVIWSFKCQYLSHIFSDINISTSLKKSSSVCESYLHTVYLLNLEIVTLVIM